MCKVICKIILTIIIGKIDFYQYYADSVVTGWRSGRRELPFSPALNRFWSLFFFFSFGGKKSLWVVAVAHWPEASKQTFVAKETSLADAARKQRTTAALRASRLVTFGLKGKFSLLPLKYVTAAFMALEIQN